MKTCVKCGKTGEDLWLSKSGYCRECAEEILREQESRRPPIYKRWWFMILAAVALIAVLGALGRKDPPAESPVSAIASPASSVSIAPEPTPEPTPTPFGPVLLTGKGDDVAQVDLPSGVYVAAIDYSGDSNFSVWTHANDDKDLTVNTIGRYSGSHVLWGGPTVFEVSASDAWSIEIDTAKKLRTINASGHGDTCPGYYVARATDNGVYRIEHSGDSNFAIWMYTSEQTDLLVNEIGDYDGKKLIDLQDGEVVLFQVSADGDWSITRAD